MAPPDESVSEPDVHAAKVKRGRTFCLIPEFSVPRLKDSKAAAVADDTTRSLAMNEWVWDVSKTETMHPFWGVKRLTSDQLEKEVSEQLKKGGTEPISRFNCELKMTTLNAVNIVVINASSLNQSRMFEIPFLTNFVPVKKGEELILEIHTKKKRKKNRETHMAPCFNSRREERTRSHCKVREAQTEQDLSRGR
jgi:hypothetical protein